MKLRNIAIISMCLFLGMAGGVRSAEIESVLDAPWYVSVGLGLQDYEGDEEVEDGTMMTFRLGYDYNNTWGLEGVITLVPNLDENYVSWYAGNGVYESEDITKRQEKKRIESGYDDVPSSQIPSWADASEYGDTYSLCMAVDGLYHFTRWERLDPYLVLGGGFILYGEDVNGENFDPAIRAGAGVMYHFNDEWSIRADARTLIAGNDTEVNAIMDAGIMWRIGAHVGQELTAVGASDDWDRDGLKNVEETSIGTDPYDPDTDKDGLWDGAEVLEWQTNPLDPDTDVDGLIDGDEVHKHGTDPRLRDTDNGGVADGHEVMEDGTDPLDGSDDLILYELYLNFDLDQSVIKPMYYSQLDIIVKVLRRNPSATARIEGHADRNKQSGKIHNDKLSKNRAKAVLNYFVQSGGIEKGRLSAEGYGFDRPKAPNDPEVGNPVNRRVEVYIKGADRNTLQGLLPEDMAPENK